jgi:hypothetical protein
MFFCDYSTRLNQCLRWNYFFDSKQVLFEVDYSVLSRTWLLHVQNLFQIILTRGR